MSPTPCLANAKSTQNSESYFQDDVNQYLSSVRSRSEQCPCTRERVLAELNMHSAVLATLEDEVAHDLSPLSEMIIATARNSFISLFIPSNAILPRQQSRSTRARDYYPGPGA